MAWTPVRDWDVGDIPGAAEFNEYMRDNLDWLVRPADVVYTATDVVNTVTATDLLGGAATIPGAYMGTRGAVRGFMMGDYKNQVGSTESFTLELKFGGTTVWKDTSGNLASNASRHIWLCEFLIANLGAANSQFSAGVFVYSKAGGATTGVGDLAGGAAAVDGPAVIPFGTTDTIAVDTTASCAIVFSCTHSVANASLSMRLKYASFELVGQAA